MRFKYSLMILSLSLNCGEGQAKDMLFAMVTPSRSPVELTLANGDRLSSSRYAGIITPVSDNVNVIFDGVTEAALNARVSLDYIQFEDNEIFMSFLKEIGIKDSYINRIGRQNIEEGFSHSEQCVGARSECIVASNGVDFVIDYYNQSVRIFVSPELLKNATGDKTYLNLNGHSGIVNNLNVYYHDMFGRYRPNYYLRDQGTAGMGAGSLNYNFYGSEYQKTVDELYYTHALFRGNKMSVGRMQSSTSFNPSSTQSLFTDTSLTGIRLGTADELTDRSYGKKVFRYYSPVSGMLEIRRNGELIYALATQSGFSDLNMANLPAGKYNAVMQVKTAAGDVVSTQNILINNTLSSSHIFSWHLFAGQNSSSYGGLAGGQSKIIETGLQIPVGAFSSLFFGGGKIEQNNVFSSGFLFERDNVSVSSKVGLGSDGLKIYELNSYVGNLSLSYKNETKGGSWSKDRKENKNTSFSASYNMNLIAGLSTSLGYMYSSAYTPHYSGYENVSSGEPDYYTGMSYSNKSAFANLSYSFNNGSSVYLNANHELGGGNYSISLGVNIPLGENFTFSNNSGYTQGKELTNNSTVGYNHRFSPEWSSTLSAGIYQAENDYNSLGYNLSHNSNFMRGTGYVYATNKGTKQLMLSTESTQVFTSEGMYFIPAAWKDSAFVVRDKTADFDISVKNMSDNTTRFFDKTTDIIRVPAYSKLLITSNTDGYGNVFADGKSKSADIYSMTPGAAVVVRKKTIGTNTSIVTLKNADGSFARTASCTGEGCVSSSRLSQGVFRVKYTGDSFILRSGGEWCHAEELRNEKFIYITCSSK